MSDQNSRTRLETFGIRPDLFDALQNNSVSKNDLDLVDKQTQIIDSTRGYCCAYQSLNITTGKVQPDSLLGWTQVWRADERLLPFDRPVGPSKGAHVGNGGIVFDQPGLWTVYVLCRRLSPSQRSNNPASRVSAHIYSPDGSEYANRNYYAPKYNHNFDVSTGEQKFSGDLYPDSSFSVSMVFPVVIPEAGYKVSIGVYDTTRNVWWAGGTDNATLAVLKHDNRTENPGQSTVPDE